MKPIHYMMIAMACLIVAVVFTGSLFNQQAMGLPVSAPAEVEAPAETAAVIKPEPRPVAAELSVSAEAAEKGDPVEPPAPENFIFLGDSLIANPENISHVFTEHGHQVLAGCGATIPQFYGVSSRTVTVGVSEMGDMTGTLADREFGGIVILLGANDLPYLTAAQLAESYERLLEELSARFDVPVFVLKIYPVNAAYTSSYAESADRRNARAEETNRLLEEYCAETEGLWFVDGTGAFTDASGYLLHDVGDGLHINTAYYDLFYDEIESGLLSTAYFN